jgi:hypothetical protein
MSLEQPSEKPSFKNAEADVDMEGNPRQKWIMGPDDEVFFGSEKEMTARKIEKAEESK